MGVAKKQKPKKKVTKVQQVEKVEDVQLPAKRVSDEPIEKKVRWTNKERVLVFAARGIGHRDRHLMEDLKKLMPHHKKESKMERSKTLEIVNEMCEMKNCSKAVLFEGRKQMDLYMWLSNIPKGPCVKFLVQNVHTMAELKFSGNCLTGSRPLLSFDPLFNEKPHYSVMKELLTQVFGVPNHHPKSQPFFDHVYTFTILDNRIWFRNFQILSVDGALAEIGPRFCLNPVKIFSGSFTGDALWQNQNYISPSRYRREIVKGAKINRYTDKVHKKAYNEVHRPKETNELTPLDDIFTGDAAEKAEEIAKKVAEKKIVEEKVAAVIKKSPKKVKVKTVAEKKTAGKVIKKAKFKTMKTNKKVKKTAKKA
ncbi:PREDICTED: ribosome biogenesis protein BRX1 homolog [Nicrophorus vespilloides]|uniref:Ribosome biogenesis protein BRX1 homolog n=1 Tax=Nicrophorus vespilloides TaxID=110193 RepID=A0ABM1MRY5_NICVS|nr:PREDICTED: ribosome biogenesis protein BRX1 homolog [Nicrophorus vespilloides]